MSDSSKPSGLEALAIKIRDGIVSPAKKNADNIVAFAREQANLIIKEANTLSDQMLKTSREEAKLIKNEVTLAVKKTLAVSVHKIKSVISDKLFSSILIEQIEESLQTQAELAKLVDLFVPILSEKFSNDSGVYVQHENKELADFVANRIAVVLDSKDFSGVDGGFFKLVISNSIAKIEIDSSWIANTILSNIKYEVWKKIFGDISFSDIEKELLI